MNAYVNFAQHWQAAVWRASWQGAIALAVAWLVCQVLRGAPAAVRCWVWRLTYLKMFAALFWVSPLRIPLLAPHLTESMPIVTSQAAIDFSESTPVVTSPLPTQAFVPPKILWTSAATLLSLWLVGLAVCVARVVVAWRNASRWRNTASPCSDPNLSRLFDELCERVGRRAELLCSDEVDSPLLIGLFRPAVVLPTSIVEYTSTAELRLILAHELAHQKRLDLAWDWLATAAGACFFFHPFVWVCTREWHLNREIACDELARDIAGATASEYGRTLINVISRQQRQPAPALFALGIGERSGAFRRRIKAMKNSTRWSKKQIVLTAAVLAIGTTVGTIPWRLVAAEPAASVAKPTTQPDVAQLNATTRPTKTVASMGTISAATVEVRAPVDGKLREVKVQEGDAVKEHALLFAFDSQRQQAALDGAMAELQAAESGMQRARDAGKSMSNAEMEQFALALRVAQAKVSACRVDFLDCRVVTPVGGTVTDVNAMLGQYVSKGTLLTTIVNNQTLKVDVEISPEDRSAVQIGEECHLYGRDLSTPYPVTAKIVYIAPSVSSKTGMIRTKALITSGADKLIPGMFVNVQIGS